MKPGADFPLVVIRVPTYNHENYVASSLKSIAADDYPNKKVIVVDDCSTDRTPEIAEKLCKEYGFSFRRNVKNQGVCATLNDITREHIEAPYFFSVASDDELVSGGLSKAVTYMETQRDVGAVYARVRLMKSDGTDMGEMRNARVSGMIFTRVALESAGIPLQWMLYRKEVYETVGMYVPGMVAEDVFFFNKVAQRFAIGFVDCTWIRYRQHDSNSNKAEWKMYQNARQLTESYRGEWFYEKLLEVESLNWWLLLADRYPREAIKYFWKASRRWRDRRFIAGVVRFLRLGFVLNIFRRR